MGNFIRLSQQESGAFQNYFLSDSKISCWESDYNNGEAFFALVRMYEYTGDGDLYLPDLELSGKYLMEKYSELVLEFYSWGTMGFSELYLLTGDTAYRDFVHHMADKLLESPEIQYYSIEDFYEGIVDDPPPYSQIVQTEGLLYAYKMSLDESEEYANIGTYLPNIRQGIGCENL